MCHHELAQRIRGHGGTDAGVEVCLREGYPKSAEQMIVSASRRTDIPAFYAEWFVRRVRAGYCEVPNPMNPRQVARVSLLPEEVDAVVFWTRSPRALLPRLAELDVRGLRYYFQFTICGYGPPLEVRNPPTATALDTFKRLASRLGPDRVIWRYDPLVFSEVTTVDFHLGNFESMAMALKGYTHRCVVSIWDNYRKLSSRLEDLTSQGVHLRQPTQEEIASLIPRLAQVCAAHGMEVVSCAEPYNLRPYGVCPGKCIDDEFIGRVFGLEVSHIKHSAQRKACGCVVSKDIGMYDSCLFGCTYCYATSKFERSRLNYRLHNPDAPSLLGWYE